MAKTPPLVAARAGAPRAAPGLRNDDESDLRHNLCVRRSRLQPPELCCMADALWRFAPRRRAQALRL